MTVLNGNVEAEVIAILEMAAGMAQPIFEVNRRNPHLAASLVLSLWWQVDGLRGTIVC